MTRKHFELIAATIRSIPTLSRAERAVVATSFANNLSETNARFDYVRFIAACMA